MRAARNTKWELIDLPDLTGRTAIVTGANSGLGFCTAEALAAHGAKVTMAIRDLGKGQVAADQIRATAPAAHVDLARLDLADLTSVRAFAQSWSTANPQGLDLLINNAGIMAIPKRNTADGFEMQLGTNHLGHFALTGLLLPALVAVPNSRIVTVASLAHRMGRMNFEDLMGDRHYGHWRSYSQSKLANLLFTAELQRRIDQAHLSILALAAHPGFASTNLQSVGPSMRGSLIEAKLTSMSVNLISQSAAMGALPTLFAATTPGLAGDTYIGPDGFMETRGHPEIVGRAKTALNTADARRLWQISEQLTGVTYPFD
ncbi:MAG: oxidoreductase [Actinomycetota bacterium]|nr:oxidoreductase [Actinomycetota bacterium]